MLGGYVVYRAYRGYTFICKMRVYLNAAESNIQVVTEKICSQKLEWFTLDDGMVGGKSTSTCRRTDQGNLEFKGTVRGTMPD